MRIIYHKRIISLLSKAVLYLGFTAVSCNNNPTGKQHENYEPDMNKYTDNSGISTGEDGTYAAQKATNQCTDYNEISGSKDSLSAIMTSIANGNKYKLASLCLFPLERKYPLYDIQSPEQLIKYFDIMFDNKFRERMKRATIDDWYSCGWRGYGFGERRGTQSELSVYDILTAVNYYSDREKQMLGALQQEEIKSLHRSLQAEKWVPYACLLDVTDNSIIRIDVKEDYSYEYHSTTTSRLLKYKKGGKASDIPDKIMFGTITTDGSANEREFNYKDNSGLSISFMDFDGGKDEYGRTEIDIEENGNTITHKIKKTYWRDVMKQ